MATTESTRVFVKNLPPTITEDDFRKHFARGQELTDVKLIPNRRIGFLGFKSHQDAAKAVKYFHRSYIRLSKISVELARPVSDAPVKQPQIQQDGTNLKISGLKEGPAEEGSLKKRKRDELEASDPKLQEFLDVMNPGKKLRDDGGTYNLNSDTWAAQQPPAEESDDEYEEIPSRKPNPQAQGQTAKGAVAELVTVAPAVVSRDAREPLVDPAAQDEQPVTIPSAESVGVQDATDDTWLRSRTNRLLDLVEPDDPSLVLRSAKTEQALPPADERPEEMEPTTQVPDASHKRPDETQVGHQDAETALELLSRTSRIFIRNLPYTATEDDIRNHLGHFGEIEEVHLPVDRSGKTKGFAYVTFENSSDAIQVFQKLDGSTFQGRIIHLLAAKAKKDQKLDEYELSKLPLKKQNLLRKKEAAGNTFNWNALYMNQDAVNESVSRRLGISKADFLDPTASDAAVKQAVAESQLIQETKSYFAANGVDLNAFKSQNQKGDKAILVKNFQYGTSIEELRKLFEEHGTVIRVLMPPAGTIAIVEMVNAKAAFSRLAYRRFKDTILFLEKAPRNIFNVTQVAENKPDGDAQKMSVAQLLERNEKQDHPETSSLHVGNLNFSTTTKELADAFKPLDGFVSAQVKTKQNPKKPGQLLSMGFGFVAFRSKAEAMSALKAMDGFSLGGHKLVLKPSHRGLDAAEERRREEAAKKAGGQQTKLIIKNLPFQVTRKDVRGLLPTLQIRSVRLPKKFDHSSRGYAFVDFVSPREAENAMKALSDVHVLGRKLVLEWAEAESADAEEEIRKMESKVQKQVNKVTLQQLTGKGRAKIKLGEEEDNEAYDR